MSTSPSKSSYKYKKKISLGKNETIGDFKIGEKIGQGTFSKVCQGIHIPTGEKVAIKILPKNQIKEKNDKIRIEKEISLQKKLHHQNIIQQYSILDTESSIYIITEYCSGGELFDYIVSKRRLQENEACRIFQQLINGLEYLHKQKICHRDLKPENLLFDSKHNLKIADFGLSNDYIYGKLSTPCGSPCYAAPEMVTGRKYFGDTVDIWSSGIVLYSMVCGYLPFEDDNQTVLFHKIAKGLFALPPFLSNSCKDLIKNILITNPKKRYGFEEIKKHPWFMSVNNNGGKNILFTSPGILIDIDVIPIDIDIIKEIYFTKEYKNFSIINIVNDVIRNKHNKITTAYYLILKKKLRKNKESVANINSNSKLFIEYIKKPISKMEYWNNDYDKIIDFYTNKAKDAINKEKSKKKSEKEERFKKPKQIEIYADKDFLNINDISNMFNEEEEEIGNKYIETTYVNDIKLSTIVYDDEEKDFLKKKKKPKIPIKLKYNNYQKDTEENYLEYKMNNYELDSDEPIIREISDSSRNKKQFYEIVKTNENIVEENPNDKSINSEYDEINKIIKKADNSVEVKNMDNKDNGRNKKVHIGKRKNNSISGSKKNNIKDLILKDKKSIQNNKNITITEVYKNNNFNLSVDKTNRKEKEKEKNNIKNKNDVTDTNKKEKTKKKKINSKKYTLPSNSYFYRKIFAMIDKEEKALKFINKKIPNNPPKEKEEKKRINNNVNLKVKNNYYMNKIKEKLKYNKRNESQEYKIKNNDNNNFINISNSNFINGHGGYKSVSRPKREASPNSQFKNIYANNRINNLKIKNINNYNIDIYKYKINLINNNPNYIKEINLQEFYKKLNDLHNINRYNKFISSNQNKNNIYNNKRSFKRKKYLNNSINLNHNNIMINQYLNTENNNNIYKKVNINNQNNLELYNIDNNKNRVNPILLSEKTNKERKIINAISQEENIKLKKLYNQSIDKNAIRKDKIRKIKKYLQPKIMHNGHSNSVEFKEIKPKNLINNRNINTKYLDINNNNTYYSNNSKQNLSLFKEKTPKNNLITDLNYYSKINNDQKIYQHNIHNKNHSYDIRNELKYRYNLNKNSLFNNKNIIYHKKFINLNKRYNNSVESNNRQKKYILDLLTTNSNNNKIYNNSLIALNSKNKKSIVPQKKHSNNNFNEYQNTNSSIRNMKGILIRKNHGFSQEKVKKNYYLNNFSLPGHAKILQNKNNNNNCQNESKINNFHEQKIIEKINKIPSLICCNFSIDKIKEAIEKVFLQNLKSNSDINVNTSQSGVIIKCKFINKFANISFELHVSSFNDAKNYVLIKPSLIKGNKYIFIELFGKIKAELLK